MTGVDTQLKERGNEVRGNKQAVCKTRQQIRLRGQPCLENKLATDAAKKNEFHDVIYKLIAQISIKLYSLFNKTQISTAEIRNEARNKKFR